jgi:16S rRNA (uracil1498-N3)-methyltransferase
MTRRRFIADEVVGDRAGLVGDHADHLVRVLRARVGQEFDISTGSNVRRGQITALRPDRVEFELFEEIPVAPGPELTLLLAVYKFDRIEWAIEKCTELGVGRIIPVISKRTDSHLAAASAKRVERWRRMARQASEQSRRATPPEICEPMKFSQVLKATENLRIILAESETQTQLHDLLERKLLRSQLPTEAACGGLALAIGPEGGWTEEELRSFDQAGWLSASLGPTILRAETAAIAATAIVISALSGK